MIEAIEKFANSGSSECEITKKWVNKVLKEGSKQLYFKELFDMPPNEMSIDDAKAIIENKYHNCPFESLLNYRNTDEFKLVNYSIEKNSLGKIFKISFVFSKNVLKGMYVETVGANTIYPIFIDIYLDMKMIVGRGKAKTTIYNNCESKMLKRENSIKVDTIIVEKMDEIDKIFKMITETDGNKIKNNMSRFF